MYMYKCGRCGAKRHKTMATRQRTHNEVVICARCCRKIREQRAMLSRGV